MLQLTGRTAVLEGIDERGGGECITTGIVTFKTCELSQVQEAHGLGAVDIEMFLSLALKNEGFEKVVFRRTSTRRDVIQSAGREPRPGPAHTCGRCNLL